MVSSEGDLVPDGYPELLAELKARVRATQFRAVRAANVEVARLYWSIGRDVLERQERVGWGAKVVTQLASDLKREFPDQTGWSRSNLLYMRRVAEVWPTEEEFVHQAGGRLPWRHVTVLLDKLDTRNERDWYAERAAVEGWSRSMLEHHIKTGLHRTLGAAPSNFTATLESADSDLAQQLVKDPYVFEHLAYVASMRERDVEQALMDRLQDTLMEFGRGMALVGRQYHLPLPDGTEFIMDLLLFHVDRPRYVVVELKVGQFEPAHLGQLGAYVAAVDGELRRPDVHAPTVGILLCTSKSGTQVQYSLASTAAPIAVADYLGLPEDARAVLPSAAELQAVVGAELDEQSGDERSGS